MNAYLSEPVNAGTQKLKELLNGDRTCMMTKSLGQAGFQSKPMRLLKLENQGVLWLMTSIQRIDQSEWPIHLAFSNEADNTYVSISGTAHCIQDREKIKELWSMACKPWFPDGPESSDIALIKVVPNNIEYWDGPSNAITKSASLLASVVAGKPIGMGEHGLIKTS